MSTVETSVNIPSEHTQNRLSVNKNELQIILNKASENFSFLNRLTCNSLQKFYKAEVRINRSTHVLCISS